GGRLGCGTAGGGGHPVGGILEARRDVESGVGGGRAGEGDRPLLENELASLEGVPAAEETDYAGDVCWLAGRLPEVQLTPQLDVGVGPTNPRVARDAHVEGEAGGLADG